MSGPSAQTAAGWLKATLDLDWIRLSYALSRSLQSEGQLPELEATDLAEALAGPVAEILRIELTQAASDGVSCSHDIDSDQRDPFVRRTRRRDDQLLDKLKRISPFEFEGVCKTILESLGATARRTQQSADGGVDFTATGLKLLASDFPWPQHCTANVIGQAKRYTAQLVYERDLRELVGASLLYQIDMRRSENIPPLAPLLLALWTTSDFHVNAKKFAREVGVWLMDGETICAYLERLKMREHILSMSDDNGGA